MAYPTEGKPAPPFSLPASNGKEVSLSDFAGKNVVLYFYPRDNTPGCTTEACAFRDASKDFDSSNTVILGVSPDSVASHEKFIDKFELPFLLLADTDHEVAEAYGVWQEKNMYGKKSMGIVRSTFVIDKAGTLVKVFPKVKVDGHDQAVLEVVRGL